MVEARLRLDRITKHFFDVVANQDVDLAVRSGEIHALLGENGAGKSTACSILAGLYHPDSGRILVDGKPKQFGSPSDALEAGIGMVYQHFRLVDELSVAENIVLGHPDVPRRITQRWLLETFHQVSERFGLDLDPLVLVGDLAVGQQQRVEIARLLHRGVNVLILDEPTAVLTPQECDALFDNLRKLASADQSVVIVTHKLSEVLAIADWVTVMRAGRVVSSGPARGATPEVLSRQMVGREIEAVEGHNPGGVQLDRPVLRVEGLTVEGPSRSVNAVAGVSFTVNSGEILGVCGVSGNGQRELAEALAGMRSAIEGSVWLSEQDISRASVVDRADRGMSYVPEDRLTTGIAAGLPIEVNLLLRLYRDPNLRLGPIVRYDRAEEIIKGLIDIYDIRGVRPGLPTSALSGGNIQRAILAREISRRPSVLVAASPTRGLDVAATMAVRRMLLHARQDGLAVLLLSEDLDELFAISDRLVVMYEGAIVGGFDIGEASVERIGELMAGVGVEKRPA